MSNFARKVKKAVGKKERDDPSQSLQMMSPEEAAVAIQQTDEPRTDEAVGIRTRVAQPTITPRVPTTAAPATGMRVPLTSQAGRNAAGTPMQTFSTASGPVGASAGASGAGTVGSRPEVSAARSARPGGVHFEDEEFVWLPPPYDPSDARSRRPSPPPKDQVSRGSPAIAPRVQASQSSPPTGPESPDSRTLLASPRVQSSRNQVNASPRPAQLARTLTETVAVPSSSTSSTGLSRLQTIRRGGPQGQPARTTATQPAPASITTLSRSQQTAPQWARIETNSARRTASDRDVRGVSEVSEEQSASVVRGDADEISPLTSRGSSPAE